MFKNRNELQEALFECNYCNSEKEKTCLIRNEDLLGSYSAKVWITGINPHCFCWEEKCFQEGKIVLHEWKDRAKYYFTKKEKRDFCGNIQENEYTHFNSLNKKLDLKMDYWVKGKISYVDFYKIGTKNEVVLKSKIKENQSINKCPDRYFINQLLIQTPNLLIVTGKELRAEFNRRWKDDFVISENHEIWKSNISELEIQETEWNFEIKETKIKVIFCMSFSAQNNPKWTKRQLYDLHRIIMKYVK